MVTNCGDNFRYWCCPRCGMIFTMGPTWESNTMHLCHGSMAVVLNPFRNRSGDNVVTSGDKEENHDL